MSAEEFDGSGPGLSMTPDMFKAITAGMEYAELRKSAGYKRLMGFLQERTLEAGEALLNAQLLDDRSQIRLVCAWRERQKIIADIVAEIEQKIHHAKTATADVDVTMAQREGLALNFNGDDEGE